MQTQIEQTTGETKLLQRCIHDLISLVALPATWSGAEPAQIARTLIDALAEMLQLELVYVWLQVRDDAMELRPGEDSQEVELVRAGMNMGLAKPQDAGALLRHALGEDPRAWPVRTKLRLADAELSLVVMRLGLHGEFGALVAASERQDFAQATEDLLLSVAVNQAVIALQGARLLGEQARLTSTLDQQVARRTRELASLNEILKREISERKRVEEALRESERSSRSVIDGIPGFVAMLAPDGSVEAVNRQIIEYTGQPLEVLQHWGTNGTVHPDDMPHVAEIFVRSIAAGTPYQIEQRLRRFDGAYRWFDNRGIAALDSAGRIVRWYVLLTDIDEKRQAREVLRAREGELRQIVDNIPVQISLLSPTGSVELINQQILDYTQRTKEELQARGMNDLVHSEDLPHAIERFTERLSTGDPFEIVYRMRRFDGVYRWFEGRHRPLKNAQGRVFRWCISVNDIDDRKRAEDALRESERNARLIVDSMPGLVSTFSAGGEVEGVNRQLVEYTGRTLEELRPWATGDTLHPDDRGRSMEILARGIAHGEPYEVELRIRRFDGAYRWFQARGLPLQDASGRIVRWYSLLTDIEDLKRAEEELRRSEAFLAEGQRLSSMGSFSWRLDTDEITFSDELYRIFDFDRDAPVTLEQIGVRVHPEDIPLLSKKQTAARSGIYDHDYDIRLRMADGSIKHLRTVGRVNPDSDGRPEFLGTIQDITERQLSEDALENVRSELAHVTRTMSLGVLTASIAHEVNQPLAGIITNASTCLRMLAADPPNVGGAIETARRTVRDGNRASDVISRLRALFRSKDVTSEAVDLNEATHEVIALSWQNLQRRQIALLTDLDDSLPRVSGDRVQLQQVILNLLSNATEAMQAINDRPRTISIRTARGEDGAARLSVQDTGVGLASESLNKLFDAFYTTKADGMGIGLSVSRSIIQSHRGRLWCEPNDGPGVTFAFSIPVALREERPTL
jgi:PAS domain S-box-containing protein